MLVLRILSTGTHRRSRPRRRPGAQAEDRRHLEARLGRLRGPGALLEVPNWQAFWPLMGDQRGLGATLGATGPSDRAPSGARVQRPKRHVWTAPSWQGKTSRRRTWSVQPCVWPVCAVHMTAGHNASLMLADLMICRDLSTSAFRRAASASGDLGRAFHRETGRGLNASVVDLLADPPGQPSCSVATRPNGECRDRASPLSPPQNPKQLLAPANGSIVLRPLQFI